MNITKQQRKIILICLAVIVASYIVRSIVNFAQQQEYMRQQFMRAAQQQAKAQADARAKAKAKADKDAADRAAAKAGGSATSNAPFQALTTVSNLTGTWKGQGALTGHGLCDLRLELRETHDAAGHYTGYSALSCLNIAPLMTPRARNKASAMQNRLNPAASILTGAPEDGSIRFHVGQDDQHGHQRLRRDILHRHALRHEPDLRAVAGRELPGRADHSREGREMTHDESFQPNLKALRRILIALIAGAVVTFGIALFLIMHPAPQPTIRRAARKCTCQGAGICCLRTAQPVRAGN